MFSKQTYQNRRKQLTTSLKEGILLLFGNNELGMNYSANTYRFRQDSNFLYFFGINQPNLAAIIDLDEQEEILFGNDLSTEEIVWVGPHPTMEELANKVGVGKTKPFEKLADTIKVAAKKGRTIHFLPPYRFENKFHLQNWLSIPIEEQKVRASDDFIKAVVNLRAYKSEEEIIELEKAVNTSRAMHHTVMKAAKAGMKESELVGIAKGIAVSMGGDTSYPIILTTNGQTLHNHYHGNTLQTGQLILADMGAETVSSYAGDITRTFPVDKKFSTQQRDIYNIVLEAEEAAIKACQVGVAYKEIHLQAARIIATGLKTLGLMKGDVEAAVAAGAHALFFPHGLGHMIGLDVHDMEDLGENYVGYSDHVQRSDQFGTAYLRLGRTLEAGFVLTVEPGIYFIPELIDHWQDQGKFLDFINYEKLDNYRDFGGIRIEDNILITNNEPQIIGKPIAKTVDEIENLRS